MCAETPPTRTYRLSQPPQPLTSHPPATRHPWTPPRHQHTPRNNLDWQRGVRSGLQGTPREFTSCGCVIIDTHERPQKAPHTNSNPLTPTSPTSPPQRPATLPGIPSGHLTHQSPNNRPPQPPTTRYTTGTTKIAPKYHQPTDTASKAIPTAHQPPTNRKAPSHTSQAPTHTEE